VFADDGLICGQLNAKRLIVRNVAFKPLDIRAKPAQHAIRLWCRSAELFAFEGAHLWNIPFDDKLAQNTHRRTIISRRLPWITSSARGREPLFVRLGQIDFTIACNARRRGSMGAAMSPQAPSIAWPLRKAKVLHQVNQFVAQSKIRRHPVDREKVVRVFGDNNPAGRSSKSECGVQPTNVSAEASDAAGPPATPRWRQLRSLCASGAGPSARRPVFERLQYPLR
jgi:hypothetical protein